MFRGEVPEEPVVSSGYLARFKVRRRKKIVPFSSINLNFFVILSVPFFPYFFNLATLYFISTFYSLVFPYSFLLTSPLGQYCSFFLTSAFFLPQDLEVRVVLLDDLLLHPEQPTRYVRPQHQR